MKKIIISIIISSVSLSALSQMTFNMPIPQPDFVSNDWDNDGIPNKIDTDDDNDGIDDEIDSIPFGQGGQNSFVEEIDPAIYEPTCTYIWKSPNKLAIQKYMPSTSRRTNIYLESPDLGLDTTDYYSYHIDLNEEFPLIKDGYAIWQGAFIKFQFNYNHYEVCYKKIRPE
jgi:hypothetical protein